MKIKVLVDEKLRTIDSKDLDGKIHLHRSGRKFDTKEIKELKATK